MNLATAIAQSATEDVEAGGLWWRIRRITTAELVEAGGSILLAAKPEGADAAAATKAIEGALRDPKAAASGARFMDAVACAGIRAASEDGKSYEDLRVVLTDREHDPGSSRLHVGSLPPGVAQKLAGAILKLSTNGGAAGERLASFLAGDASRAGRRSG